MKVEEARRHLSALVRSSEDAIVGMTLEGIVVSWNPAAEALWGYPGEGMVGKPIDHLFLPERKKDWTELLGRLREGSPVRTVEMTHRRSDGRFLSTSVSLSTIVDDRGRPVGISLIARDITEQMKADRVREAQYEVARILGEVPTVRQAAPRVLEILCRNLEWETGVCWLRAKEPGIPPDLVSWPADVPLEASEVDPPWDVSSTGHPLWIENVSALRGGAWADWTIARGHRSALLVPLRCGNGTTGMIGLFDSGARAPDESILRLTTALGCQMTLCLEREHAEGETRSLNTSLEIRVEHRTLQLQEAIAELDAFAYTVSHDLRAPLRAMHGFSQALLEDYSKTLDPTGREYARRIADATQRMDTLILDLLTYSRLGREELPLEPVALSALLDELLAGFRMDLLEQNADIEVAPLLPSVLAHSVTLRQVVTNLLTNALKFVREGTSPRIRIRAERLGDWGRIWFEDNGIGIEPAHHERIFRVFERLNKIECYPGTGIGLAIVRRGMEKMGGRVGVVSSLGEGSRFWIELPIIEDGHESDGFHAPAGRG
jgi:PAS domain S-box-containing protein